MSQIVCAISEISRRIRRYRRGYMEPMGLKGVHSRYLTEVCRNPGISQDKLAQRLGFDKSNVARQAAFLEEEGFLHRQPGAEDKRVLCLHPTEKTLDMLPGLQAALQAWEDTLTEDLSPQEKEQLYALLSRVRQKAERMD